MSLPKPITDVIDEKEERMLIRDINGFWRMLAMFYDLSRYTRDLGDFQEKYHNSLDNNLLEKMTDDDKYRTAREIIHVIHGSRKLADQLSLFLKDYYHYDEKFDFSVVPQMDFDPFEWLQ